MADVFIREFQPGDEPGIVALILPIQRDEFKIQIQVEDQPDLKNIPEFYQAGAGEFWVAVETTTIVGTVALKDIGNGDVALRKMFVAPPFRGSPHFLAKKLLDRAFEHAKTHRIRRIILGTTDQFLAAHRFYEKNGFVPIAPSSLPESFPRMAVDTRFYVHGL